MQRSRTNPRIVELDLLTDSRQDALNLVDGLRELIRHGMSFVDLEEIEAVVEQVDEIHAQIDQWLEEARVVLRRRERVE